VRGFNFVNESAIARTTIFLSASGWGFDWEL
jgi:hypothetical protein